MFSLRVFMNHESYLIIVYLRIIRIFFPRGQGAGFPPKPNIHEIRWLKQLKVAILTGASIPGKVKSTKFVKQILSTYTTIVVISRFAKQCAEGSQKETMARSFLAIRHNEILRAKRKGGEG
jgi:hypothetical protein